MNLIYFIIILLVIIVLILFLKFSKKKKLSQQKIKYLKEVLRKNIQLKSEKEKLINSDKIYHKILLELNYS